MTTIALVIIDRITKLFIIENKINMVLVPGILSVRYTENRGMIFGIAQGSSTIMGVISLFICLAIVFYIIKSKEKDYFCFAWYLILAGGIGNMLDRFIYGYVVDFIDTPWIATFNLADSFIVVGVFILIIHTLINSNYKNTSKMGDRFF